MMELPIICTCEAEGIKEVEERRLRIFRRMRPRHMRDLTEAIVLSLAFDFACDAKIYVDQWFGISLETTMLEARSVVGEGIFIPCDQPADGFAAAWEWLAERFPDRVTSAPGNCSTRVAERISATILAQCMQRELDYREHRDAAHHGPNDCPPCEDCDVLLSLVISSHIALDTVWGSRSLDDCVDAAFEEVEQVQTTIVEPNA